MGRAGATFFALTLMGEGLTGTAKIDRPSGAHQLAGVVLDRVPVQPKPSAPLHVDGSVMEQIKSIAAVSASKIADERTASLSPILSSVAIWFGDQSLSSRR
jgi:hypothetical protein